MEIQYFLPGEIEKRSFEIIGEELSARKIALPERERPVTMRVIHTSADFDYAKTLKFSENAVLTAENLILSGADIVTDTNMAKAGISGKTLAKFGGEVRCFMADDDVASEAKKRGATRAAVSMEKAARLSAEKGKKLIFAVGNAPTALISLYEMMEKGIFRPDFVIGVPVGFVNVVEAKELFLKSDIPFIVNEGRKGGSNVAAAICNAILYGIAEKQGKGR